MADKAALQKFWRKATPEEREQVAKDAGTTAVYLYQQLNDSTRRKLNLLTAVALEDATLKLNKKSKRRVPVVTVRDLAAMYGVSK